MQYCPFIHSHRLIFSSYTNSIHWPTVWSPQMLICSPKGKRECMWFMTNTAAGYTNLILDSRYWTCTLFHSVPQDGPRKVRRMLTGIMQANKLLAQQWLKQIVLWVNMHMTKNDWNKSPLDGYFPVSDSVCLNPELTNVLQQELVTSTTYIIHHLLSIAAIGHIWTVTGSTFNWMCVVNLFSFWFLPLFFFFPNWLMWHSHVLLSSHFCLLW